MCVLSKTFNGDTRTVRVFNLSYHLIWLILLLAHITKLFVIDLPDTFEPRMNLLIWLILSCISLSILSLITEGRRRILTKYVSLLLGSLIQLIIAYKYVTLYPPLTPMVIVSSAISLWFMAGALFVKKANKEKIHGVTRTA
nr:MAG TPA: hypothetical protein [Caudoviricetes sp.]